MRGINVEKITRYAIDTIAYIVASFVIRFIAMFFINNHMPLRNPVFELMFVKNYGAAFNLFHGNTGFLIFLSTVILLGIIIYLVLFAGKISFEKIHALSLLSAGIGCNLIERSMDGYVTDYLHLTFVNFPVFNLSDILITVGAILLVLAILKK